MECVYPHSVFENITFQLQLSATREGKHSRQQSGFPRTCVRDLGSYVQNKLLEFRKTNNNFGQHHRVWSGPVAMDRENKGSELGTRQMSEMSGAYGEILCQRFLINRAGIL